jgi:hypothetical protein
MQAPRSRKLGGRPVQRSAGSGADLAARMSTLDASSGLLSEASASTAAVLLAVLNKDELGVVMLLAGMPGSKRSLPPVSCPACWSRAATRIIGRGYGTACRS